MYVHPHAFNRARRCALTTTDLGPFKGRPGRAGTGQQALVVAQHDFRVGAHVHQQRHFFGKVRPLGQDYAGGIRAHMPGDAGQHINARIAVDREIDLDSPQRDGTIGGQRKRRPAEFDRIDAQQQVVHDGVADEGGLQDVGGRYPNLACHIGGEFVDRAANRLGHLLFAARVHHHVGDPAHQVFTKTDLRVHQSSGGHHITCGQIAQMRRNRGGAHVDGDAVGVLPETRPDRNDLALAVHGYRDLPVAFPQRLLQLVQYPNVTRQIGEPPLELERVFEPAQIA